MSPAPKGIGFVDRTRATMHALYEDAQRVDIRNFEESSAAEVEEGLTRRVAGLAERAIAVASELLAHYDAAAEAATPSEVAGERNFDLAVDTVLARTGDTKVSDLAFMAAAELRQRLRRLEGHGPGGDAWEMVCDCGSVLRRVQKSLGAIELALCEAEQLPRVLDFTSELETSLQVRRQYRKLWRFVGEQGEVGPDGVRNALRGGGTLFAMLVGRDVYCRLRERDRYQIRQLQRRVLAWLAQDPPDPKAGVRLWEDLAGFVSMLRQVNLRQELVQHDAEALRLAEAGLAERGATALAGALAVLKRVEGLDDALDAVLAARGDAEALLAAVRRLRARFAAPAPQPTPSPSAELF